MNQACTFCILQWKQAREKYKSPRRRELGTIPNSWEWSIKNGLFTPLTSKKQRQKQKKTPDHGRECGNIQWISKPPTHFPTPAVPLLNFRPFPSRSAALWTVPEVMHCTTYTFCSHKYTPPQISLRAATRVHQPCPCRDSHPGQRNCESSPAGHSTHCRRQAAPPLSNAGLDDTPKCASSRGSGSTAPPCHSLINLHHMVLLPTS